MVEYGYINEGGYLISRFLEPIAKIEKNVEGENVEVIISVEEQIAELVEKGWKPVEPVDDSRLKAEEEFHSVSIQPFDAGDRIGYNYVDRFNRKLVEQKINEYKNELSGTDYKVIKCYEALLIGEELPYDVSEIHVHRQTIRDEINRLEGIIR